MSGRDGNLSFGLIGLVSPFSSSVIETLFLYVT